MSSETTSGLRGGGYVATQRERLFESASALGTDAWHAEPLGRIGGDDSNDAPEPLEQRAGRRRRDPRNRSEYSLGCFVSRTRARPLCVGGAVGRRLDLLAANG